MKPALLKFAAKPPDPVTVAAQRIATRLRASGLTDPAIVGLLEATVAAIIEHLTPELVQGFCDRHRPYQDGKPGGAR